MIGCKHYDVKFGSAYNKKRKEVGLQEIQAGWKVRKVEEGFAILVDTPYYAKTIRYEKGKWTEEEDVFYSGRKFETIDGDDMENVQATYYFTPTSVGFDTVTGWHILYTGMFGDNTSATSTVIPNSASFTINSFNGASGLNTLFTVRYTGNVGIGVTNPQSKLAVAGTILHRD